MPSPVHMLKLPAARAGQIKALATAKGIGLGEAVEHLLNLAIEAGDIDDSIPGWEVKREGEFITLTLDGQPIPAMHIEVASTVAGNFERAGTEMQVGRGAPQLWGFKSPAMPCAYRLTVGRHGSGVVIVFEEFEQGAQTGEGTYALDTSKRTVAAMTRGMAVDLARQIRNAITAH